MKERNDALIEESNNTDQNQIELVKKSNEIVEEDSNDNDIDTPKVITVAGEGEGFPVTVGLNNIKIDFSIF